MKKYIYIGLILLTLNACDDLGDAVENTDAAIAIGFKGENSLVTSRTDSVKISLKSQKKQKTYTFVLKDEDNKVSNVTYEFVTGQGEVFQSGAKTSGALSIKAGTTQLSVEPFNLGVNVIEFQAVDKLNRIATATLELIAFENIPPQAVLSYERRLEKGFFHYNISGKNSVDGDQNYGGGIVKYIYTVAGKTIESNKNEIDWVFGDYGEHEVTLQVQDRDGAKSSIQRSTIVIK